MLSQESPPSEASPAPSVAAPAEFTAAPAIRGSIWTMGGYAVGQVLRLLGNLVLTRLLFPEVFGQMALVFIFIQGLQMFSDVGIGPSIVQNRRGDDPEFLQNAWTLQAIRGALLGLAACALAWPAAAFYEQPSFRWLVPAAALTAVIAGFESTAVHSLQRHLRMERLTILELAGQASSILATVVLAAADRWVYGPGHPGAVWAIVLGSLVASTVRLVLSHTYLPGIPHRFRLDRETVGPLLSFGRWIFVSTLLTFLAGQLDRLIFGKSIPLAMFGVYSIATMLASLPTAAVLKVGSAVVFPAYSRVADRPDFEGIFWRVRWPLLLGGGAIVAALFASAPFLIAFLYDRRYADAGWILQYQAAIAWFQVLEMTNGAALLAKGRVRWVAAGSLSKVIGMAIAIPLGQHLGGFPGALVGLVSAEALKYATCAAGAWRAGLKVFAKDAQVTAAVAATSALAFAAGSAVVPGPRAIIALAAALIATAVPWGLVGLWYLGRIRAARAAAAPKLAQ